MKPVALIMAGGRGERFWPKSRQSMPKQFLSVTEDGKTLLQKTVKRVSSLVRMEDIYICTNENYIDLVRKQLPDLTDENIISEPVARNTAPCIGLAAIRIANKYPDAVMIVLPSDHMIRDDAMFVRCLRDAIEVAEKGENLVTLGIHPTMPETGYGYIRYDANRRLDRAYSVEYFEEKPDYQTACRYLESGRYFWNGGIFVWKVSTILNCFARYLPEVYEGLEKIRDALGTDTEKEICRAAFLEFPSVSIDNGVMEKAQDIYVVACDFDWDDVGSWLAMERLNHQDDKGNVLEGNVFALNTSHCTVQTQDGKMIVLIGMEDTVVVDTPDALLISAKKDLSSIKTALQIIRNQGLDKFL